MIGRIRGIIMEKQPPHLVLDVNGVGYELEAPMTTFYSMPDIGAEIQLYTHLAVREDAHLLFGFARSTDRQLFRTLIKVTGVGTRMALTILSGMEADEFATCVQHGDTDRLVKLPGVGKKTAERLVVEMRDRLRDWNVATGSQASASASQPPNTPIYEAESALIALGYKPQEASRYVNAVARADMTSETIIREALKALVNR